MSEYDDKFLLKPTNKINSCLIIEEADNIQHIMASLALKVTSQSVIIGKLSSYARKNRTKKALWCLLIIKSYNKTTLFFLIFIIKFYNLSFPYLF